MSTYYDIHTEVCVKDKWYCADPLILTLGTDYRPGDEYRLSSTFWSGSRSYFGDAENELRWLSVPTDVSQLSEGMQNNFARMNFSNEEERESFIEHYTYVVPFAKIKDKADSVGGTTCHGIVHKDVIAAFESGDCDDIYDQIEPEEYTALAPEARKCYQYYEWDEPSHWLSQFKRIIERVNDTVYRFTEQNLSIDVDEIRIILIIT